MRRGHIYNSTQMREKHENVFGGLQLESIKNLLACAHEVPHDCSCNVHDGCQLENWVIRASLLHDKANS